MAALPVKMALFVEVIEARGVKPCNFFGKTCDSQVFLHLNEQMAGRTQIRRNTVDPVWQEVKQMILSENPIQDILQVYVFACHWYGNALIGRVEIPVSLLLIGGPVPRDAWFKLLPKFRVVDTSKATPGFIHLGFRIATAVEEMPRPSIEVPKAPVAIPLPQKPVEVNLQAPPAECPVCKHLFPTEFIAEHVNACLEESTRLAAPVQPLLEIPCVAQPSGEVLQETPAVVAAEPVQAAPVQPPAPVSVPAMVQPRAGAPPVYVYPVPDQRYVQYFVPQPYGSPMGQPVTVQQIFAQKQ